MSMTLFTSSDPKLLNHVKSNLKKKFEIKKLGYLHYFLSLQILQTKEGNSLSQSKYAYKFLCHFHVEDCKLAPSPFQSRVKIVATSTTLEVDATLYYHLVGILLYFTHYHHDISFIVGLVSWYMQTPHEIHWKAAKRILQYIQGIVQFRIHHSSRGDPLLVGFIDFDWSRNPNDQNSSAVYVFSLGYGPITWTCKKQQPISLSSVEVEYYALFNAIQEALWIQ
jgi:hypothetical protein